MEFYIRVEPDIIYPECIQSGRVEDCFKCYLFHNSLCNSPRSKCLLPYKNHKKGCPNYGKKESCPPNIPMFDKVFNMGEDIYAIYSIYDLENHVAKMRDRHPTWTEAQLYNVLYWQGTARKQLKEKIIEFKRIEGYKDYYVTTSPEAMGVDVTSTLKKVGIDLDWPARRSIYKVAFAGKLIDEDK